MSDATTVSASSVPASGAMPAPPGPLREFWGYFSANHGAVAGLVVIVIVLLTAALAPVLAPHAPDLTNNELFLKPPAWQSGGSWAYPLGTDAIGRDILSRLIYGARLSLLIGIAVVALSIVVGIALGLLAGFARGITEIATMTIASSRLGSVRMMSISRMIAISVFPRANPAISPSAMPTTIDSATTAIPISSESRAP